MGSKLERSFNQRWWELGKRGLELPSKDGLFKIVLNSWNDGFKCEYCGTQMVIKSDEKPPLKSYSLDHKQSLSTGGDNSLSNFAVVCTRCNIVKGTLRDRIYMKKRSGWFAEKKEELTSLRVSKTAHALLVTLQSLRQIRERKRISVSKVICDALGHEIERIEKIESWR